ncbi:AAA family ATPase [Actinomadura rugatobispora]|uniref:AAA family ATPase n=1 Tax=Actinomadura rugatobispora TaxID=1994 RepID=A0ABW0ZU25_9ACTN|nr:AAA family ATPase [Actinomadura rugatobispora]
MTSALIGREHPASVLDAEIERATTSHGGLVLVTGEAGIGKTSLVTSAVQRARGEGVLVLGGSCWDSAAAPGYWPWTQVVRALGRAAGEAEWARLQELAGAELGALLGESPPPGGAGADGFRLYDAVTTALVAASQRRPVVVVLDDLHWADAASVRLLEFAARHTWFERLLLVGAYRDVEVEGGEHPLRGQLAALAAQATMVTLTGLGRAEVGALMSRTVGLEPEAALVAEVHRRTGGNPFFVEQTARLWHGGGTVTAIAPGVRAAVQRRLSLLAPPVGRMLTAAAVLGREFHRRVLAATAETPVPHVDRLLDQALAARLVTALGEGRYAFAHDLVRETLYDALDEDAAREAHAAVVRALDRSPALAEGMLPTESARHAHLAGDLVDPMRAVRLLKAAADHASARLSVEEAALHLRRALERVPPDRLRDRTLITLELGGTLHRDGGADASWRAFEEAIGLARKADDPELLARVALAAYRHQAEIGGTRRVELLREAHRRLVGGAEPAATVPPYQLAQEVAEKVTGMAREGGDEEGLAFGLWARHDAILGLGTAAEREALTVELADIARRSGDRAAVAFATSFRWVALLEQGDPRYLDHYRDFVALTQDDDSTLWGAASLIDKGIVNTLQGRFEEAAALITAIDEIGEDEAHQEFGFMGVHLRWALAALRGAFDEATALHAAIREHGHPYAVLLEGITAVERGDAATALRLLEAIEDGALPYPRVIEPLWLRFLAQAAAVSGDPRLWERARSALLPHRGLWAVALYGCDVSGPTDLWLGLVDAAQGRWDDAVERLTAAFRSADRLGARPWSVEARVRLGLVLAARGRDRDRGAARALLAEAVAEAEDLGMLHVPARAAEALADLSGDAAGAAEHEPGPSGAVFRFDGRVWTLSYEGRTVHLPDAKGLRDLHHLLGSPGTPIPAVTLLAPEGGEAVAAARRMGGDDVLDERAKASYRRRLEVLDEEIDRAAALGDDRRAAEHDRERAALLEELRAAAGLAGRTRRLGDEAERARKAVTARIRDTLRKLDHHHPELAGHLRASVSTGATCLYQPHPAARWRL